MLQFEIRSIKRDPWLIKLWRKTDVVYFLVIAIFLGIVLLDRTQLIPLVSLTLSNLGHTSIYMAIAVLLLAGMKATGAEASVATIFKGRENRMIVLAALVGGLAPFCSCEVIPFIAGLLALGTPLPPIMAFWLSSPLIDPPTLLITAGSFGWKFAISKAFFAVAIGLYGGFAMKVLIAFGYLRNPQKSSKVNKGVRCCAQETGVLSACCDGGEKSRQQSPVWLFWKDKMRVERFFYELRSNGLFLLKWMLFAYTLESLMIRYVPIELVASVVGGEGVVPIIVSALVGVPAYLNSYIAPPIVAGLIEQGMSQGSGMTFIVAGAVSSIPAMTAVYALVRKSVFAGYVMLGFSGAVFSGILYNIIG